MSALQVLARLSEVAVFLTLIEDSVGGQAKGEVIKIRPPSGKKKPSLTIKKTRLEFEEAQFKVV